MIGWIQIDVCCYWLSSDVSVSYWLASHGSMLLLVGFRWKYVATGWLQVEAYCYWLVSDESVSLLVGLECICAVNSRLHAACHLIQIKRTKLRRVT